MDTIENKKVQTIVDKIKQMRARHQQELKPLLDQLQEEKEVCKHPRKTVRTFLANGKEITHLIGTRHKVPRGPYTTKEFCPDCGLEESRLE